MVKVKALREHSNAYGENPVKKEGVEYDLPENLVKTLTAVGLVEEVKAPADKAK